MWVGAGSLMNLKDLPIIHLCAKAGNHPIGKVLFWVLQKLSKSWPLDKLRWVPNFAWSNWITYTFRSVKFGSALFQMRVVVSNECGGLKIDQMVGPSVSPPPQKPSFFKLKDVLTIPENLPVVHVYDPCWWDFPSSHLLLTHKVTTFSWVIHSYHKLPNDYYALA